MAKQIIAPPDQIRALGVREVLSMSDCVSPTIHADPFLNALFTGLFVDEPGAESARNGRSGDIRVLALGVLPIIFDHGVRRPMLFEAGVQVSPLALPASHWRRRGYDAVEIGDNRAGGYWFSCSPLSCNYEAEKTPVNEFCLIDLIDDALRIAARFSIEEPEPGPYAIFEVWERIEPR